MAIALELSQVGKSYKDVKAVQDLSFTVEEGEIFGLLGPNGAGKSTTIHMISGLARVGAGHIQIFGKDVGRDFRLTRRWTGLMHQEVFIDNFFTVEETLKIHAGYYGFADDPVWRKQLVERLALGPYLKRKPLQLSGGTKRRLMLAKALIHKPRLLILDEPTAGVDVELRRTIWEFVQEINRGGATILLTTHYLEEAERMCSRIAIMNKGRLAALDRTETLLGASGATHGRLEDVFLKLTKEAPTS
ncbi:MAG: ABC transporter ATP-binding protein [Bdellovibrionales bacterium]|nr:ABC transporter ATP-binding protein [Bdellovibrionales bacterium]